jgi:hypothetical protein
MMHAFTCKNVGLGVAVHNTADKSYLFEHVKIEGSAEV